MKKLLKAIGSATLIAATPAMGFGVENLKAKTLDVTVTKASKASPEALWGAVGEFCDIPKWHPAIVKCVESKEGSDSFRTLSLDGGGEVYEKKVSFDTAGKSYSYTIEKSPLPVKNYTAKIAVSADGEGSSVTWSATFNAKDETDEKAVEIVTGIFEAGLNSLVEGVAK